MRNDYSVTKTPATKVTVTITRRSLWYNYMENITDMMWDDYNDTDMIREIADVLLSKIDLSGNVCRLTKLFRDGWTVMMLGSAMPELDKEDILREIIITDNDQRVVISHEDINF